MKQNRKMESIIFIIATLNILFAIFLANVFWGGFLIGGTSALLFLYFFGKVAAGRAIRRIDKRMRDYMEEREGI